MQIARHNQLSIHANLLVLMVQLGVMAIYQIVEIAPGPDVDMRKIFRLLHQSMRRVILPQHRRFVRFIHKTPAGPNCIDNNGRPILATLSWICEDGNGLESDRGGSND